jgi:REP element-mobilizing transposase RayT
MVLGHHIILGAYGFWLPNDPRGSWSDFVRCVDLYRFGRATKTDERRSVAAAPHDASLRVAAKRALRYPPVRFSGIQARAVGRGFAEMVRRSQLNVWACAILPDHAHLVVGRHRFSAEQMSNLMKGCATRRLIAEGVHPLAEFAVPGRRRPPRAFACGQWKVFLDSMGDVRRAIQYVEANPGREGLPPQRWSFVRPFGEQDAMGQA